MATDDTEHGRFLLFLDILGFRRMVETKRPYEVYQSVNQVLVHAYAEKLSPDYDTIHFSDTFVIYSKSPGYSPRLFYELLNLTCSNLAWSLAKGIPLRGALTFGEFSVTPDWGGRFQVFFGKALHEAYDQERKRKLITITLCANGFRPLTREGFEPLRKRMEMGVVTRKGDDLVLLPIPNLPCAFIEMKEQGLSKPEQFNKAVLNDLQAFRFLIENAKKYSEQPDSPEYAKYQGTVEFLREALSKECFEWAEAMSRKAGTGG